MELESHRVLKESVLLFLIRMSVNKWLPMEVSLVVPSITEFPARMLWEL